MKVIKKDKEFNQLKQDIHTFILTNDKKEENQTNENELIIGNRIRVFRKQNGSSIRSLAMKCGISVNTLSLIENDRTSPNINTLKSIADGLGVSVLAFFEEDKPEHSPVYQRQGQRPQMRFSNGALEKLGEGLPPLGAEPILVTLENTSEKIEDISHTGREFIYCLKGKMTCFISEQPYPLRSGDSILFNARSPHRWINAQPDPSQLLVLFCPMNPQDQPAERHLEP
ncbi:MAG TPA: cupin domain-containing protein [Anaerolineales bacterium]|nr:cupin domain-containing protein [Anaerolineales bacterium]